MSGRQLHQTPSEIRQAMAMSPDKRARKKNKFCKRDSMTEGEAWLVAMAGDRPSKGMATVVNMIKARRRPHR